MVVEGVAACVVHALQTAAVPAVVGEARRVEHGDGEPAVVDIRAVLRDEPGGAPGEITLGGRRTVDQHRLVVAHEGQPLTVKRHLADAGVADGKRQLRIKIGRQRDLELPVCLLRQHADAPLRHADAGKIVRLGDICVILVREVVHHGQLLQDGGGLDVY